MNNKIKKYCLLLWLPALVFFSCSQEDVSGVANVGSDDSGIVFRISLPSAVARSTTTTVAGNLNDGFYVSAFCPEDDASYGGTLDAYFIEQFATPTEDQAGYFGLLDQSSELWVWPTTRHGKQGQLRFFAFYPSRKVMRHSAREESGYFGLKNKSTKSGSKVTYDYRLEKFKINKDIIRHIDFVTATAEGSRRANGESGVRLDFEHQLSRVSFQAWGNTVNDIEIAGVRIGCAVTESDFNFAVKPTHLASGDNTVNGNWVAPQVRDCVEYIFREGDTVVKIGSGNLHTSEATAVSIMGNGGWAMVIPADNPGWNHTIDASNASKGLYFSVLMRVKGNDINKNLLYPYVKGEQLSGSVMTDDMTVIYLSIEQATGKVMKRLYRSETGSYFTDSDFTTAYVKPETEEIRNYGWAAIPLTSLRWKPGYQYTYILNYTNGVGVHDPNDPCPGKPIISKILVDVTESGKMWPMVYDYAKGDEMDVTDKITIK